MNNSFGDTLRVTIFGASHASELGVVIEGLPRGIRLSADMFTEDLERRRPKLRGETSRVEADMPHIEGTDEESMTTGEAITITFRNANTRSGDYSEFEHHPRPSHADLVQRRKYGSGYDISGGGLASGRMTVALVAAGVVAKQLLSDVSFASELISVGGCEDSSLFGEVIAKARAEGDSVGGTLETAVVGIPAGVGAPFFDSLESMLAHLLFAVPGVKGVEFGMGFGFAYLGGSEANDQWVNEDEQIRTKSNMSGGINGGITNGMPVIFRTVFRPTPSIAMKQQTVDPETREEKELELKGHMDPAIFHRARVVVDSVAAIGLFDLLLERRKDLWS